MPSVGTHEDQASSDQSGAALRALLTNPPQGVLDVSTEGDLVEIPEAETYANVGVSTSFLDLEVKSPLMSVLPLA